MHTVMDFYINKGWHITHQPDLYALQHKLKVKKAHIKHLDYEIEGHTLSFNEINIPVNNKKKNPCIILCAFL